MKKIITAAAIAAMAASFAAADVKVGLNARVRPDLYSVTHYTENGKTDAYNATTYADLNGFGSAQDTFSVKGSTDYAGVVAEATFVSPQEGNQDGSVKFDNYYAWVNWGALKFTAGVYDSRYTNRGNYTATEQGILDEEFSKTMGLSTKNGIMATAGYLDSSVKKTKISDLIEASWLGDFGNVAQTAGKNNLSFLVDYTFQDVGGGSLLLKGGLVENSTKYDKDGASVSEEAAYDSYGVKDHKYKASSSNAMTKGEDGFYQAAGYVAEAAWRKDDAVAIDFIFKNPLNKAYGVALYVTPLFIPNAKNVVVGFTYGTQEDLIASAFAIDLRGTYNITSQATFALGAKYEMVKSDVENEVTNKDGTTTTKTGVAYKTTSGTEYADTSSAFQIAGEFSYKFNDLFTAALDLGYFNADLTDWNENDDDSSQEFTTSLRGKFTAGKNAAITTAVRFDKILNPKDGGTDWTFDIPVVLRVKM